MIIDHFSFILPHKMVSKMLQGGKNSVIMKIFIIYIGHEETFLEKNAFNRDERLKIGIS